MFDKRLACFSSALIIAVLPILISGQDVWAETLVEYFWPITRFSDINLRGRAGYFSLTPQVTSAVYHTYYSEIVPVT